MFSDLSVLLAVSLAGLAQGLTGFGFGIVAMAGLTPLVGAKTANLLVTPLAGINIGIALWEVRRHIDWRRAFPLCVGGVLGTPIGVHILLHSDPLLLRRLIGAVILLTAAGQFRPASAKAPPIRRGWGFVAGALGGVMGGAVAMAGPPAVVYAYRQPWPLNGIKATLLLFFGWSVLYRLVIFAKTGTYAPSLSTAILSLLPPVVLFTWLGGRLTSRLPRRQVDLVVGVLLTVAGAGLLFGPGR